MWILNDSSLFIKVGLSKLLLSNIFIAFCLVQYKLESYKTEPVWEKKSNLKTSFNKCLSLYIWHGEADSGRNKKIFMCPLIIQKLLF